MRKPGPKPITFCEKHGKNKTETIQKRGVRYICYECCSERQKEKYWRVKLGLALPSTTTDEDKVEDARWEAIFNGKSKLTGKPFIDPDYYKQTRYRQVCTPVKTAMDNHAYGDMTLPSGFGQWGKRTRSRHEMEHHGE